MPENGHIQRKVPLMYIMHHLCVGYYIWNLNINNYAFTDHQVEIKGPSGDDREKSFSPLISILNTPVVRQILFMMHMFHSEIAKFSRVC